MQTLRLATLAMAMVLSGSLAQPGWAQAPQTTTAPTPAPAPAPPGKVAPPVKPTVPPVPATSARPAAAPPATPSAAAPTAPARATAAPAANSDRRVDINSATEAQLDSLPGIGPVRSKAIIAGRPYADLKDLVTKKVLTQGVLDGIKGRVALVNINTSSAAELQRSLPGIGDVRSKAIVAGRPYASPDDLVAKKVLTQGVLDGIKDLVTF